MIDHVGDQLAGRGLGLDAGDELAARPSALAAAINSGEPNSCCARAGAGFSAMARPAKPAIATMLPTIFVLMANLPPVLFIRLIYPVRATLPGAAPRDSQFAPPMRTPSKTVCTRLKAAVFPRFPPS